MCGRACVSRGTGTSGARDAGGAHLGGLRALRQVLKILEAQFQKKHYSPAQATAVLSFDTESVRIARSQRPHSFSPCVMMQRLLIASESKDCSTLVKAAFCTCLPQIICSVAVSIMFHEPMGRRVAPGAAAAAAGAHRGDRAQQRQPRPRQAAGARACSPGNSRVRACVPCKALDVGCPVHCRRSTVYRLEIGKWKGLESALAAPPPAALVLMPLVSRREPGEWRE